MKKIIISSVLFILSLTYPLNSQWVQMIWNVGNMKVLSFAVNGDKVFAGEYGVWLSTNNGLNWARFTNGLVLGNGAEVYSLASSGQNTFAGIDRVYLSTNFGTSWIADTNGMPSSQYFYITSLAISGNYVFAGTYYYLHIGQGIFRTTVNGSNWTQINTGLPAGTNVASILVNVNGIFIGTYSSGIYNSTNNGDSWIAFNNGIPSSSHITSIVTAGNVMYASSYDGHIYSSTNNGNIWVNTNNGFSTSIITTLATSGSTVFVGTQNMGIFKSTNNGLAWYGVGMGILPVGGDTSAAWIHAIICNNTYAFCAPEYGNNGRGIYRRPLSELTAIKEINSEIPEIYSLSQNYPNPFNPSTIIKYDLSKSSAVKLIIYDAVGREVKTLVNENQNAGSYKVEFDGSNLSSGLYYYKIQSGEFTQTKKMVLIK